MSLRDALHRETWLSHGLPPEAECGYCDGVIARLRARGVVIFESREALLEERDADAILADPAFREALVEAVADALGDIDSVAETDRLWRAMGPWTLARAIVDRLVEVPR